MINGTFNQFIDLLVGAIVGVISHAGYVGIVVLMAIESACVPLPSEIIMPFAGYLASTGRFNLFLVATFGAIGCNLGSSAAYFAAAYGGRKLIERWGHFLLIRSEEIAWSERFFARHGAVTVFVGRLLPVVRTFIAVPAGLARMPQLRFQIYTFVGSWPWCFVLALVGYELGEQWERNPPLRIFFHRFDAAILVVIAFGTGWFLWRQFRVEK